MNTTINILHLEDLPSDALFVEKTLKKSNIAFRKLIVDTRDKFITALTAFSPDIILSDHSLPSFNSIEALKLLREANLNIPFIIVTAAMSDEAAVDLIVNGADDYIIKDRLSRLPVAITNAIEKFRLKKIHQTFLETLIKSEKRYRALIEHSADGVVILDQSGKPKYVSASVKNVLGYEPNEVLNMDLFTLMHPDEIADMTLMLKKILNHPGKTIPGHTGRMLHKDGSWRWIEATVTNLLDDPDINGIIDNFRDVTERVQGEQLLSESGKFTNAILSSLGSHICVIDNTGVIVAVNKAWADFGKTNGAVNLARTSQGTNYFEICEKAILAGDLIAKQALDGVLSVFNKDKPVFEMEYQCDSPEEKRWYVLHVMKFGEDQTKVVLSHQNITEQKIAIQRLAQSELSLKQAQSMAKIGSWEMDLQSFELSWSEQAYRIFETNYEQFTPTHRSFLAFCHPYDRVKVDRALRDSVKDSSIDYIEHRIITASGTQKTVEQRWIVSKDDNGLPISLMGTCQDITEKKALERLLDKATTMARIGSYEVDLANDLFFWSPMTKLIHEVDHDFIPTAKTALDFYKPGLNRQKVQEAIDLVMKNQTPFDLELQIVTANGNDRWVRVIGEAELVNEKCILYGSFQDIDKIKETELEVLRAYEEKNVILESIGDAFFAVDKDWIVNYWNKEANRLLHHTKEDVLNKNLWEVFPKSVGSESYKKYNLAVQSKQIVHFEDYYPPMDSWLEVSAYPSSNGLSVFFKDITARKLADKKLNDLNDKLRAHTNELVISNKGLEQFSYMVSHNLRAPVANIIGLGGLLKDETYPSDIRQEFLNGILENVQRLDDVIVDLNLILQVKRQISEKKETVNLQILVDTIQSSIKSLIVKEKARITTDFTAADEFETMKTYLHSIFYNLILNSIKYRKADTAPVIEIRSSLTAGKLIISFKDNGLGIDLNKKADQIFGLYKRFHHHVEGKGMGLFMVKTQVEMLGGTISVNSEVNLGTTFLIEFNV
ncbi:PAS domain S-box protein [Dyadobacter psychrotolerans]|nr:PAS domain S-box protein [Dyadobacter psychrotolerans]